LDPFHEVGDQALDGDLSRPITRLASGRRLLRHSFQVERLSKKELKILYFLRFRSSWLIFLSWQKKTFIQVLAQDKFFLHVEQNQTLTK